MIKLLKTIENDEEYLRQISKNISFEDNSYKKDINLMEKFCLKHECFALSAIQIGIPKRIIYLKNTTLNIPLDDINYNQSKVLINPVVISKKGQAQFWESCLSCLDNIGLVNRPYEIIVHYYDINGIQHETKFEGFEATVLAHELDHLDGILYIDLAEQILVMPKDQRKAFREKNPYKIISKTCKYNEKIKK